MSDGIIDVVRGMSAINFLNRRFSKTHDYLAFGPKDDPDTVLVRAAANPSRTIIGDTFPLELMLALDVQPSDKRLLFSDPGQDGVCDCSFDGEPLPFQIYGGGRLSGNAIYTEGDLMFVGGHNTFEATPDDVLTRAIRRYEVQNPGSSINFTNSVGKKL